MRPRIVGAMVLAALAVILLPMLFDFDRDYTVDTQTLIPGQPDIEPVQIARPQPVAGNENGPGAELLFRLDDDSELAGSINDTGNDNDSSNGDNKANTESELKAEPPGLTEEGIPISWVLQIGSFADLEKAKVLVEKLRNDQYRAFSKPASAGGKKTYRVFVGPKILKKDMLDEKLAIEQKYKIETLLRRFEP